MSDDAKRDEQRAWDAIVADLSSDMDLVDGGQRLQINDPRAPDRVIDELLSEEGPSSDQFVPEEPPQIPVPADAIGRFAWAGVIAGPLLAFVSNALSWGGTLTGAGVIAFVAGFVTLVARMDREPRDDDDGDGAVV